MASRKFDNMVAIGAACDEHNFKNNLPLSAAFQRSGFFPAAAQAGMIAPSRTLRDAAAAQGHLTVLSEPPGFDIVLDGQPMGKTPVFLITLQPGAHRLKVNNQQTTIRVEAGKTLQISLYKGSFIKIPVTPKQPQKQIKPPVQKPAQPKPPAPPADQSPEDGLTPMERYRLLKHY